MAAHAPSPAVGRRWPAAQQAVLPVLACGLHACGTPTHSAAPPPACTRARMWPTWDPPSYPFGAYSQADVHACFFCASSSMRANQPSHPKCVGLRSPSFPHRPHTPRKGVLPQGAGPSRSTCCMHSVASQHTRRSQESLQHAPHNIWASGKTIVSVHRVEAGLPAFICTDAWRKGRAACICAKPLEERQGCLHLQLTPRGKAGLDLLGAHTLPKACSQSSSITVRHAASDMQPVMQHQSYTQHQDQACSQSLPCSIS